MGDLTCLTSVMGTTVHCDESFAPDETAHSSATREVHVYTMSGSLVIELQAGDLRVENLKDKISDLTGVRPYQQTLHAKGRETPLLDAEILGEVHADLLAQSDEPLTISMVTADERHARGPFALGQDLHWGCWEGMSSSSGPLSGFDGRWRKDEPRNCPRWFLSQLEITGEQGIDGVGKSFNIHVRNGQVYFGDNFLNWEIRGEHLCAMVQGHTFHTYSRIA